MRRVTLLSTLVSLPILASPPSEAICLVPPGDVTQDGAANVLDVQCVITGALFGTIGVMGSPTCLGGQPKNGDLDCNGLITLVDVQLAIGSALGAGLAASMDTNADGCADACAPQNSLLVTVAATSGIPIEAAVVSCKGSLASTDASGLAWLAGIQPGTRVVTVSHAGHAPASFPIDVPESGQAKYSFTLVPLEVHGPFAADAPILVNHGLAQIEIPAGGVFLMDGTPAVDPVEVRTAVLGPNALTFASLPGPLVGAEFPETTPNPIDAYSLVEVSLWVSGQAAQLGTGAKAKLRVPITASAALGKEVGTVIPAWWYDLEAGLWRGEGAGVLEADPKLGLVWVAELSHFTWWLAGDLQPAVGCLAVKVMADDDEEAPVGTLVKAAFANGKDKARVTGASGKACFETFGGGPVTVSAYEPTLGTGVQSVIVEEGLLGGCAVDESLCSQVVVSLAPKACVRGNLAWPDGTPQPNHLIVGSMLYPDDSGKLSSPVFTGPDGSFCMAAMPDEAVEVWGAVKESGALFVSSASGVPAADAGGCGGAGCLNLGTLTLEPPAWGDEDAPPGSLCALHGAAGSTVTCPISIASTSAALEHAAMLSLTVTYDSNRATPTKLTTVICGGSGNDLCFEVPVLGTNAYQLSNGHTVTSVPNALKNAAGTLPLLLLHLSNFDAEISEAKTDGAGFVMTGNPVVMTLSLQLSEDVPKSNPVHLYAVEPSMVDTKGRRVGAYVHNGVITSTDPLVPPEGTHGGCPILTGDLTQDGVVNLSDYKCMMLSFVNDLINPGFVSGCNKSGKLASADVDCSGELDLVDVYISASLSVPGTQLPLVFDSNGDGCVDRCEVQ